MLCKLSVIVDIFEWRHHHLFCFPLLDKFKNKKILTWRQFRSEPAGSFFQRLTSNTHALQISPWRGVASLKHSRKSSSYFLLSVNLELQTFISLELYCQRAGGLVPARFSLADATPCRWPVYFRSMERKHVADSIGFFLEVVWNNLLNYKSVSD